MIRSLAKLQPWALTLLRLVLGVAMLVAGWDKIIPHGGLHRSHPLAGVDSFNHCVATLGLPFWLGYISVATEFLGGMLLLLGLLTRFTAFFITINMCVALWKVNAAHGYASSEYNLALIAMALMLIAAGSGAFSLDRRFGIA